MKKLLAFASVLMLFLCCFSIAAVADSRRDAPVSVSLDFPAEQIIVHDPEESLGYDAADEYCLAHSSEVTIRFSLPAAADPARSFVQIAYDFYEPHYFTDMPTENGCYVFTSSIDTTDTTGYPFSDLQIYINQDYAPYEQWPNHLVNIFADEASLNEWCSYFDGVSWEYPEDTPENPTDVPEDSTEIPEDPTDVPEDPTDAPEDPTDVPEIPRMFPKIRQSNPLLRQMFPPRPFRQQEQVQSSHTASLQSFAVRERFSAANAEQEADCSCTTAFSWP